MKRMHGLICMLVIWGFMFFFLPYARTECVAGNQGDEYVAEKEDAGVFHLPAALQFIGEDAFKGTPAEEVILPETVQTIQSRAFAEMPRLEAITIPDSVLWIGDDIFAGDLNVTIYGNTGSKAEEYARENQIDFRTVHALMSSESSNLTSEHPLNTIFQFLEAAVFIFINKMRMTCRDCCEMNQIQRRSRVVLHTLDLIFP